MLKHVEIALAEVGYKEFGTTNKNKYAEFFDSTYPKFYNGKKNGYAWCDIFVDYCFVKAYGLDAALVALNQPMKSAGAGCKYSMVYFINANRLFKNPEVGDQIFFEDENGIICHTGIVVSFDEKWVVTIEGNTNNMVARRRYLRSSKKIAGYGRPKYPANSYDLEDVAIDVIRGKYGNGNIRKSALKKLGIDYNAVQQRVNEILKGE